MIQVGISTDAPTDGDLQGQKAGFLAGNNDMVNAFSPGGGINVTWGGTPGGKLSGVASPDGNGGGDLIISKYLTPSETLSTLAHEYSHCALLHGQSPNNLPNDPNNPRCQEVDAYASEQQWYEDLFNVSGYIVPCYLIDHTKMKYAENLHLCENPDSPDVPPPYTSLPVEDQIFNEIPCL